MTFGAGSYGSIVYGGIVSEVEAVALCLTVSGSIEYGLTPTAAYEYGLDISKSIEYDMTVTGSCI